MYYQLSWLISKQFQDNSEFEKAFLNALKEELERADLALDTKLIITYLCNKFDGFDGVMEKVV